MTDTRSTHEKIASTTVSNRAKVEVPSRVVTAIAARLEETVEEPTADDVCDFAHEHVETTTDFVTPDGQSLETAVLARVRSKAMKTAHVVLESEDVDAIDASPGDESRAEWIREACRQRINRDVDGVALEYTDGDSSSGSTPEPIDVDATARLDFAADPARPLSVEVEIPADIVNEVGVEQLLEAVSIDARLVE